MSGLDRDVLITRVIDGESSPEDWAAFRALAERDPSVWHELADVQQDRAELGSALLEAVSLADRVEAPIDAHAGERLSVRVRTAASWLGWVAAAAVAVAAFVDRSGSPVGSDLESARANLFPISSPEDALKVYFDKGHQAGSVLGEVPERLLVSSTPSPEGGYEVVFLRQIVERQRVQDFYRMGQDEAGNSVAVPYRPLRASSRGTTY
ncbi:MAG: hypothetical protein IPJ41_00805 [Phycisphaerales bacterium]|nr:hypothetical protein [Phycisphaerales bacterium]